MESVKSVAGDRPGRALPPLLVTREEAAAALTLSLPTFMRAVREGRMPPPRQISPNRVGWLWCELEAAAAALPASTLLPPPNAGNRRGKKLVQRSRGEGATQAL